MNWTRSRAAHLGVILLTLLAACAPATAGGGAGSARNRNIIERAEMENATQSNAYALIQALRPHWLEVRGPASLTAASAKRVYLDDMALGDLSALRQIALPTIASLQYYDGPSATQRWGSDHAAGVIMVRSRR
jgi:hypothetical protein